MSADPNKDFMDEVCHVMQTTGMDFMQARAHVQQRRAINALVQLKAVARKFNAFIMLDVPDEQFSREIQADAKMIAAEAISKAARTH
jgi:hypothetical protein